MRTPCAERRGDSPSERRIGSGRTPECPQPHFRFVSSVCGTATSAMSCFYSQAPAGVSFCATVLHNTCSNLEWQTWNSGGMEQSGVERSRAELSRAEPSRAELSGAEQRRAEQSRAEQSRSELSRAEHIGVTAGLPPGALCRMPGGASTSFSPAPSLGDEGNNDNDHNNDKHNTNTN